jgi:hypothetical protein
MATAAARVRSGSTPTEILPTPMLTVSSVPELRRKRCLAPTLPCLA